jgi:hypothetical protein
MPATPEPVQVGFAEFVAKLVAEVLDALVSSHLEQEKRLSELRAAAALTPEEFADRFIGEDQIDAELKRLFPGDSEAHPSAIYVGAPYLPQSEGVSERPPLLLELGVSLQPGDYAKKKGLYRMTASGVGKIRGAARLKLSQLNYRSLQELLRGGVPKVVADGGRINAKLTYELVEAQATKAAAAHPAASPAPRAPLTVIAPSGALANLRLMVRQADERAPHTQNLKVNVFGEVELSFKTIS